MNIRKSFLMLCLAMGMAAVPSQAQVLKKLGKAINKVGSKVENAAAAKAAADQNANGGLGRQLGEAVKVGDMTMTAYGSNPGIGFNFGTCYRENGKVVLAFQLPNQTEKDVENIWLRNYGKDATEVYTAGGSKCEIELVAIGETRMRDGVTANISAKQYANALIVLSGVPADAATLGKVIIRLTGQRPMDSNVFRYAFVLENVPVTTPEAAAEKLAGNAAPAQQSAAKPAEGWLLTSAGVGPLKLGAKVAELPARTEGLYDKIDVLDNIAYVYWDHEHMMTLDIAAGKIIGLGVFGPNVGVKVGAKVYKVGGDSDDLKAQKGVKGVSYNDDAEYNGVHFEGFDCEITRIYIGKVN